MSQGARIEGLRGVSFRSRAVYRIVGEIGRGGMGIVFLADRDSENVQDRLVLKTVRTLSREHIDLLRKEANLATRLRHENIVKSYGMESLPLQEVAGKLGLGDANVRALAAEGTDRVYLIAMDYVEGTNLWTLHDAHLKGRLLLPVPIGAFIVSRLCRGLEYAHRWLVHRDVSPGNVLIDHEGVCKLTDFGLAVESEEAVRALAGKYAYMAPEQLRMEVLDGRSDLYATGIVAYEILTGLKPFPIIAREMRQAMRDSLLARARTPPAPHRVRPDIPEALSAIVMKMLQNDRADRYARVGDAGDLIEQRFLYRKGFGPTNNSLAAYLRLFAQGFDKAPAGDLRQLSFFKNALGVVEPRRSCSTEDYTPEGLALAERDGDSTARSILSTQAP
ncbi:MAG: serine/threonine protein kinase [Planctomycetes bacterium]|nr:serine/threonine protein kinase [Planctomycetota bacterium]